MLWFVRNLNGEFIQEFSKLIIGKSVKSSIELQAEIAKLSGGMSSVNIF